MRKPKHFVQMDASLTESPDGRLFIHPGTADVVDLSAVQVIHFATDTVRQLYRGKIKREVMELFETKGELVELGGYHWHPGRIGRDSGYQYRLQNADLGLILLLKSFHVDESSHGPHLKIEVSPHTIHGRSPASLQRLLDDMADEVLIERERSQCAVHLAMDVQGWTPPKDFEARMHCRSRRIRSIHGPDTVDYAANSAVYGRGETWLFGAASGVQMTVYNKSLEARTKDKLDYWNDIWSNADGYVPGQDVYRIEFRFHHSVVQQFADGSVDLETGETIGTSGYDELYPHLTGLWKYGLDNFRYLYSPGYFDPFWTLIRSCSLADDGVALVEYRRYYKTASGFSGKNVELLLGNFVSLAARNRMSAAQAWKALKSLPFWQVIEDHYSDKGKKSWELKKHFIKLLNERYIRFGKAV